jgi:hypothetical protein
VYDQKSEHTNQLDYEADFAVILLRKLTQKYAASVSFLSGGLVDFSLNYPSLCVKSPAALRSRTSSTTTAMQRMESLESSLEAATPNPDAMNVSPPTSTLSSPQVLMRKPPRQLKLSHSLSTFGFFDSSASSPGLGTSTASEALHESSHPFSNSNNSNSNNSSYNNSSLSSLRSSDSSSTLTHSGSATHAAIRQPTKILSYLFLGSEEDACCQATMEALGITSVLNVSVTCRKPAFIKDQNFLRIPVNDGPADKILPFFDIAYRFIGNLEIREFIANICSSLNRY